MARSQRLRDDLTFGGRMPWAVGLLIALTVVGSLAAALLSRHGAALFERGALVPSAVLHGEVWRLVTWPFLEPSPIWLLVECLFLYWFGKDLANEWGSPRFLRVFGVVTLAAALATCGVSLVDPAVREALYLGMWTATLAIIVAWGLWFPDRELRIYFLFPITGYWLAWATMAITAVFAVYAGWEHYLPALCAFVGVLAWLFRHSLAARVAAARRALGARRREAERRDRAKKRAKSAAYLRTIEEEDDDEPPPLPPDVEDRVRDLFNGRKH